MLRSRLRADDGFTLVELLVVVLIIGILAAIAIPTLIHQREKAQDAEAKTGVVTAAKAMVIYGHDHGGYRDATKADLARIDASLLQFRGLTVTSTDDDFTVSVESAAGSGAAYSIARTSAGVETRDCTKPGEGGCRETPDDDGNRW
jgi:type IV pilus assembly protein PilA